MASSIHELLTSCCIWPQGYLLDWSNIKGEGCDSHYNFTWPCSESINVGRHWSPWKFCPIWMDCIGYPRRRHGTPCSSCLEERSNYSDQKNCAHAQHTWVCPYFRAFGCNYWHITYAHLKQCNDFPHGSAYHKPQGEIQVNVSVITGKFITVAVQAIRIS